MIFWGNSTDTSKVSLPQKKIIRIMAGINTRITCRPLFRNFRILTVSPQYILFLINFQLITWNILYSTIKCTLNLKVVESLHMPQTNLSLYQKGVHYMGVKIFTKLRKYVVYSIYTRISLYENENNNNNLFCK